MELFFLYMLLLLVVYIFLFRKFFVYKQKSQDASNGTHLPPGKMGWPIFGETFEFVEAQRMGLLDKFIYDRKRSSSSDIFKTSLHGEPTAIFCGAAGNKFLFSTENDLVTAWWPTSVTKLFPSSLQASNIKDERIKLRKMLPGFLKAEALQRNVSVMDLMAKQHLETIWDTVKEVNVFPFAKNLTFSLSCQLFLSITDPAQVAKLFGLCSVVSAGIMAIPINLPGMAFYRAIKASNLIRKELYPIIKQRKIDIAENKMSSPTHDMLSYMLLTSDDNGKFMNDLMISDRILTMILGGNITTSIVTTFILKYLAELPSIYSEVLREQTDIANSKTPGELLSWEDIRKMKYSWNVACEVMRLHSPIQGSFKEAATDFTYSGFSIPKGWKLYWSASATHMNPNYFPDPENFDPSRFEGSGPAAFTYIPFGGGSRMCPGNEFARANILTFMHNVVMKYKWEKVSTINNHKPAPRGLDVRLRIHKY